MGGGVRGGGFKAKEVQWPMQLTENRLEPRQNVNCVQR